ncbi:MULTISPECIES: hypothetical protein [Bacillus]|uniref:hypothetical protein n=1 Tax=Bacillus TaxID=1386 RepID=UPI0002DB5357|nr:MULTISPECIES: hypothetical protein [Bacillus]
MKKITGFMGALLLFLLIAGCSAEPAEKQEPDIVTEEEPEKEEVTEPIKVEQAEEIKPAPPSPPIVNFANFDKANKRDTEEKVYMDGLFILENGERVTADYIMYADGAYYEYASAIFSEGKLARIKLETSATIGDIEKGLGITFDDSIKVDATRIGYEIIFNPTFDSNNIYRYPFELD